MRNEVIKTSINMNIEIRDFANSKGVSISELINDFGYSYMNGKMEEFKMKYPLNEQGKDLKIDLTVKSENRFPLIEVFDGKGLILFYKEEKNDTVSGSNRKIKLIIKIFGTENKILFLEIPATRYKEDDYEKTYLVLDSFSSITRYSDLNELGNDIDANENHSLRSLTESDLVRISNNYYKNKEENGVIIEKLYDLKEGHKYLYI